jgi:hypothetical protein
MRLNKGDKVASTSFIESEVTIEKEEGAENPAQETLVKA